MIRHGAAVLAASLVIACGEDPVEPGLAPLDGATVSARLVEAATPTARIWAEVTVSAPVGATGYVTLQNPCPGVLQVRATPDANAPMVWNEQIHLLGCKSFGRQVTVRGDQPYLFTTYQYPAAVILGDSLPAGQYWLWVEVRISQLPAAERLLSLGSVRIE